MNSIVLKTHTGEYFPGDEVTGAVFLHIVSPTAGSGINIDVSIVENVDYKFVGDDGYLNRLQEHENYLDYKAVLYDNQCPLLLGDYKFPFKFKIPENIPGSFFSATEKNCQWTGVIECVVKATVTDSESLTASHPLVILNCSKEELEDNTCVEAQTVVHTVFSMKAAMLGRKKGISITSKLLKNINRTGDSMRFRLIVGNNSKLNILSFRIKLLRNLVLKFKAEKKTSDEPNLEKMECIQPEDGPCVVWETHGIFNKELSIMNRVLDNIFIPLSQSDGSHVIPSVSGKHIECKYGLEVTFAVDNNTVIRLNHHVPCVLPQTNKLWESIILPPWTTSAEVTLCESNLASEFEM